MGKRKSRPYREKTDAEKKQSGIWARENLTKIGFSVSKTKAPIIRQMAKDEGLSLAEYLRIAVVNYWKIDKEIL